MPTHSPSWQVLLRLLPLLLLTMHPIAQAAPTLVPAPLKLEEQAGSLVAPALRSEISGPESKRVTAALSRLSALWSLPAPSAAGAALRIQYSTTLPPVPSLGEDESYRLRIGAQGIDLEAATDLGILRGLATLTQLNRAKGSLDLPAVSIEDRPRFAWRGLLVDVGRHFQPPAVIRRTLDAMALAKLNVLHLHVTEDQGFRIESLLHPELQRDGSDGRYFTQQEIRDLVAYAAERGIRVVPEFDLPGHATAWLVSHPELAALPGPFRIERRWGIFDPVFDPTEETTYQFLEAVLGEMSALFPDAYFHIGGDENNGVQWAANPRIQKFIQDQGLKDNHGLQAYFNRRMETFLAAKGKRMMGWDEILHPDLPRSIMIQSWRGPKGLAEAAKAGCQVLLSNGYYIDLSHPADVHYLNDPLPEGHGLTAEEAARVLGGEATMWSEWVDEHTIDTRIWPRTAAIAERLWSPATVRDVPDLYRRLETFSGWLTAVGSRHETAFLERSQHLLLSTSTANELEAVRQLLRVIEPLRDYRRGRYQPEFTQLVPLESLADYTRPDGDLSRQAALVLQGVNAGGTLAAPQAVKEARDHWKRIGEAASTVLRTPLPEVRAARELRVAAGQLQRTASVVEGALNLLAEGKAPATAWIDQSAAVVHDLAQPGAAGINFRFHGELRRLLAATVDAPTLRALSRSERISRLDTLCPKVEPSH